MTFTRFLLLLRARLPLIAAVTLVVTLASITVSLLLPARYYAEATAVLEQPSDPALAAAGSAGISYFLATQRDLVASRSVALRVIENLGLERELDKTRSLLTGWDPIASLKGWIGSMLSSEREADSQREWLTERLLQGLSVTSVRDSRLLKVGFKSREPEFSPRAANGFMQAFMEVNVHLKATPARAETAWLEGQLKSLRETLAQAEAKLSSFQQDKGIVATDEKLDTENLRLADLSTQLAGAQAEAYASDARRKQLLQFADGKGGGAAVPAEVVSSPVVMQLRQEVAMREAKLKDMSREVGPNHPRFQTAQGELSQLRGQLGAEMRSVAQGLVTAGAVAGQREAALRGALEEQKNRLLGLKKDRELMSMLARDVENAQKSYNGAMQRISEARIESANERPNASVVDKATVPARPSGPRLLVSLLAGGLLGAVLGLGLALLLEATQRLVRSGEDLSELLGVPIVAVLPARAARSTASNVLALPKP